MLKGIAEALRPDGVYLMQDIKASSYVHNNWTTRGAFPLTVSCMHCMTVSLADDGAGLGAMWAKRKRARCWPGGVHEGGGEAALSRLPE